MLNSFMNLDLSSKQVIYVDVDGTLLDPSLDKTFNTLFNINQDQTIEWYKSCNISNLKLNISLINILIQLKEQGHTLILWTNRRPQNIEMTKLNLGKYYDLFNSHEFHSGMKSKTILPNNSIVIDNEIKYLKQGNQSIHIQYKLNIEPFNVSLDIAA